MASQGTSRILITTPLGPTEHDCAGYHQAGLFEAGFTDFTDSLTKTYTAREYCVQ